MSNTTLTSQLFERFSRDLAELKDLHFLIRLSPPEALLDLRSKALAIQRRFAFLETLAGGRQSKTFSTEQLAVDIQNYLLVDAGYISAYLGVVGSAYTLLRAAHPNALDDRALALLGQRDQPAENVAAGDTLLAFLNAVAAGTSGGYALADDRDIDRLAINIDDSFQDVAQVISPESLINGNQFYSSLQTEMNANALVEYIGDTDANAAFAADNRSTTRADSTEISLGQAYGVRVVDSVVALVATNMRLAASLKMPITAGSTGAAFTDANAPALVTPDGAGGTFVTRPLIITHTVSGSWRTIWFDAPTYPGLVSVRFTNPSTNAAAAALNLTSYFKIHNVLADYSAVAPNALSGRGADTVLDAMQNGYVNFFVAAFCQPAVSRVLKYAARRDYLANLAGEDGCSQILRKAWRTVAEARTNNLNAQAAVDLLPPWMPFTASFWSVDPLGVEVVIAPATFATNWVREAYVAMYRAFFNYLVSLVNSGLTDPYYSQALREK